MELRGRRVLVTGAGNPCGIGAAICRELASRGADVFFSYVEGEDPEPLLAVEGIRGALCIDLAVPESTWRLLEEAAGALGPLDGLVNNAAHSERDGYERLAAAGLDAHYAVNLRATALLCAGFSRRFEGDSGAIVNLTSGQSLGPMPGELAYTATKGAVEAFTSTLAAEVGHLGITANAVNPGPTDTGWMSGEVKQALARKFPAGRVGAPEDAARLVAFLLSREAGWVTGQVVNSEGGFLRS